MGCDDMTRRIHCRVISSVPLGKNNAALRYPSSLNDGPDKITDSVIDGVEINHAGNSTSYTGRLGIKKVPVDNDMVGRILDCYV